MSDQIFPAGKPSAPEHQSPPPVRRRILVVDDDVSMRRLETAALTQSGYHVDAAEDGAIAWEALNTARYDLLITDHDMPEVTGLELIQKLHGAQMAVPVIMATGNFPHDEFARSPWLQPATTLLKPYSIEMLLEAVKKILRGGTEASEGSQDQSPCAQ